MARLLCLLPAFTLLSAGCSHPPPPSGEAKNHAECLRALELMKQHLNKADFRHAEDALLTAMQLDASEPAVWDAALQFVHSASAAPAAPGETRAAQDDPAALARDIYGRAEALIPFQPLDRLAAERDRYTEVGRSFAVPAAAPASAGNADANALDALDRQLAEAGDEAVPVDVRTALVQRAHGELEALALQTVVGKDENDAKTDGADFWKRWRETRGKLETAENTVLRSAYGSFHEEIGQWLDHESKDQTARADAANGDQGPEIIRTVIEPILERAVLLRQRLAAYREAKVPGSDEDDQRLQRRTADLERCRDWLYNSWAITQIKKAENNDPKAGNYARAQILAKVDENRLSGYAEDRYRDDWKKVFDSLNDNLDDGKSEKIQATRLRLLKPNDEK